MCMASIKKTFSGKGRKTVIGYKMAATHKDGFGPKYCNRRDRWEIGKWYKANYMQVSNFVSVKTGKRVTRSGIYARLITALKIRSIGLSKLRPILQAGGYRDYDYECGFHFFTDLKEADNDMRGDGSAADGDKLLLCEFKGITSYGSQWSSDVGVARKMRIIRVINRGSIKKELEAING